MNMKNRGLWYTLTGVLFVFLSVGGAMWYESQAQEQKEANRQAVAAQIDSVFVSPIDTIVKNSMVETIVFPQRCRFVPTGEGRGLAPKSCNFSPDDKYIAVTLLSGEGADIYSVDSLKLVKKLRPPCSQKGQNWGYPEGEYNNQTGEFWFSRMTTGEFFIWDPKTDKMETHSAKGVWTKVMRFSPKYQLIAFAHWSSKNITVFDVKTRTLVKDIRAGDTPRGITWLNDTLFAAAMFGEGRVKIFNAYTGEMVFSPEPKGNAMRDVRYDPKTEMLYFDDLGIPYVYKYDLKNKKLLGKVRVDFCPNTIGLTPDGKFLFVSCRGPNNPKGYTYPSLRNGVNHMIRTEDFKVVQKWEGGNQPTGLAVSNNGHYLATTDFQYGKLNLFYIKDLSAYELPAAVKPEEVVNDSIKAVEAEKAAEKEAGGEGKE